MSASARAPWLGCCAALLSVTAKSAAQELALDGGGRLREQFEMFRNREFGDVAPRRDTYLLHRLQLRGEARLGDTAGVLVEFVQALAIGQETPKAPIDEDRLDILRARIDVRPCSTASGDLRLRVGRQELMLGRGRLVSTREGPNVRQAFDGLRLSFGSNGGPRDVPVLDAFVFAPVEPERGVLDDNARRGEVFYGAQVAMVAADAGREKVGTEFYYLGRENDGSARRPSEHRHTFGARVAGPLGAWRIDAEGMFQCGTRASERIRAFALSGIVECELDSLAWRPRPGIRLDVISGDRDPTDGRSGTFDALYPNNSYFNEAAAFAPSNLYSVSPTLGLQPRDDLRIDLMWDLAWRYSTSDGVYLPPGMPRDAGSGARFVGHSLTLAAEWEISSDVVLSAAVTHIEAGGAITSSGGRDLTYVAAWVNWWF